MTTQLLQDFQPDGNTSTEEFAEWVAQTSDDRLASWFDENREEALSEIFRRMAERLDTRQTRDLRVVVTWLIARPDNTYDKWQLEIDRGNCHTMRDGGAAALLTVKTRPVELLRLVAGDADPIKLFTFGRIKAEGDLLLGARLQALFRVPKARRRSRGA